MIRVAVKPEIFFKAVSLANHAHRAFPRNCFQLRKVLDDLEGNIHSTKEVNISKYIKHLENISPEWPRILGRQKELSSIMHSLLLRKQYDNLFILTHYLKSSQYEMWSGMSTVVLNAYIELKMWDDAVSHFEKMKENKMVKHTRTYKHLITALSNDDQVKLAECYFNEFRNRELMATGRPKFPDDSMFLSMISAAIRCQQNETAKSFIMSLLKYMELWNLPLSNEIIDKLVKWFMKTYRVSVASIQDERCTHCQRTLDVGKDYRHVCRHVIHSVWKRHSNISSDIQYLDKLIDKNNSYDLIIDTGNVMHSNPGGLDVKPLRNIMSNLTSYCSKSFFNVAVVCPQSYLRAGRLGRLDFINELARQNVWNFNINVVTMKRINDDLVLLYLAAKSELNMFEKGEAPLIVSSDNFMDHRVLVPETTEQSTFLQWLRSRKRSVEGQRSTIHRRCVMIYEDGCIHLLNRDGNILCVKPKT